MTATLLVADEIHTMGPGAPVAEAVLIDGARVLGAGTRSEMESLAGPDARRVDLPGATVIPGLVESHMHPLTTGLADDMADCRASACRSIDDVQSALRSQVPGAEGWIRGWGYDDTLLREQRHPTRAELDEVSRELPVYLSHGSGHFAVGNSAALARAGLDEAHLAQDDPRFPRDEDGRLTGMAWEMEGVRALSAAIPAPSDADVRSALVRTLHRARKRGITTVHDLAIGGAGGLDELAIYRGLDEADALPVRVAGYLRGHLALDAIDGGRELFDPSWADGARFRLAGVKLWADGSIQGLSAALRTPYLCDGEHTGELLHTQEELDAMALTAHRAGAQIAVHANGDAAVGSAVEALSQARASDGRPARHRIEHCQVTRPSDLDTIAQAGLVASFFVNHVYYWGDRHRERFLGAERAAFIDPLARADALGIPFGLHSDCPVTPMDPLATIRTAATRRTHGGDLLGGDQRIAAHRAVRAMTADSAFLVEDEGRSGALSAGRRADLVVLDGNLTGLGDPDAPIPQPARVMIDGQWVEG